MSETGVAAAGTPLPIVIVGHVDHGKSTLIGRLLNDTGALPDGKLDAVKSMAKRRGMPFEWSFVMDAFQAERDQGITIDTTRIGFRSDRRGYVIIDAPGHKEFLKNMITGAASAEAALLVVDAREGVREQTRRHAYLLHLLGVRQVAVTVNKMDLVDHDRARFAEVEQEIRIYLGEIGITPAAAIPVSARDGDTIARCGKAMSWYEGPTVLEALDMFEPRRAVIDQPLRLPIQDVYKFDHRRLIAGRIESGRLTVGDSVDFAPSGKSGRVASIENWNAPTPQISAVAGQSVAFTLADDIFVERGVIAHHVTASPMVTKRLYVRLFWLGGETLAVGDRLRFKIATATSEVTVSAIRRVIDVETLLTVAQDFVPHNGIAEVELECHNAMAFDPYDRHPSTGRGVLVKDYDVVAGCIVLGDAGAQVGTRPIPEHLTRTPHPVTRDARAETNHHRGGVLWLTGLSGAGKTTLAMALERALFERGYQTFVLDGDNVRHHLNSDLGFSAFDRSENIRRVAEVARLFAEAGLVAVVSLISPYRSDRENARDIVGDGFQEIHVDAGLAVCEQRDPKGLYAKARAGKINDFTGIDSPYERPETPDLTIDTETQTIDESLNQLMAHIEQVFALPHKTQRGAA